MKAVLVGLVIVLFTVTNAEAEWWSIETSHETTAEIRARFVPRLERHRREVERVRRERREARREAALAYEQEQEASYDSGVATPVAGGSSSGGGYLSAEQVGAYARGAGFPEEVVPIMVDIAMNHESGGCPTAVNGLRGCPSYELAAQYANSESHACGLWQLYPCYGGAAWLSPATNAAGAYAKYKAAGYSLSPWGR